MTREDITKNNLENNETPKVFQKNIEHKEISQEEFLHWLDNEENLFKQETQQELIKSNSVDLNQPTFEKIKNETNIESDLNTINQEVEKYIDEARKLILESEALQKSPSYLSFESIDLVDRGEDQQKKLEEMVASGKISSEVLESLKTEIKVESDNKENLIKAKEDESRKWLVNSGIKEGVKIRGIIFNDPTKVALIKEMTNDYIVIGILDETGKEISEVNYNSEQFPNLVSEIKNENTTLTQKLQENPTETNKENVDTKIQEADSLPELFKIIKEAGGIQGLSEFYSTDQVWERVRAFINGEADENIITRTGGLREKVKELKMIREQNLQTENQKTTEPTLETRDEYKNLSYEEWRDTLPQVHWTAGYLTFRPGENTDLKDLKYFVDKSGGHYVSYTETDGSKQARKLYITANNAGISQEIDPYILKV